MEKREAGEAVGALRQHSDRWAAIRQSTAPADRSAAEAGLRLAYRAAGLDPPERIVWCGGPIELLDVTARVSRSATANVGSIVIDDVHTRVASTVKRRVHNSVHAAVAKAFTLQVEERRAVSDAVGRSTTLQRLPIWLHFCRMFSWSGARRQLTGLSRRPIGQHELAWLGIYEYFHDVCDFCAETESLEGLWQFAKNAGWMLPHEHICWLAERPNVLRTDARSRLHSAMGPALRYPDGWSFYAWKGIQVPARLIERPEEISIQAVDNEPDIRVRRCMIEVMTPERYVAKGGAVRVAEDETGVLWRKTWWATIDTWAAVEVINGTPEPDGTRKRYFLQVPGHLQSPREAVAWTYGMTAAEYAQVTIRT